MDLNFELTAQQANDIAWNHMRSIVFSGPQTAGRVLRIANNLFSGMEAQMKAAVITAAIEAIEAQAEAAVVVGEEAAKAAERAAHLNNPYEAATTSPYYADAAYLLLCLFREAKNQGRALQAVAAFHRLAAADGYRVHKLLVSLKRGQHVGLRTQIRVENSRNARGPIHPGSTHHLDPFCTGLAGTGTRAPRPRERAPGTATQPRMCCRGKLMVEYLPQP